MKALHKQGLAEGRRADGTAAYVPLETGGTPMATATCRSCRAPILWVQMAETGKRMPVDHASVTIDLTDPERAYGLVAVPNDPTARSLVVSQYTQLSELRGRRLHVSHFATCPSAAIHRRQRNREQQKELA